MASISISSSTTSTSRCLCSKLLPTKPFLLLLRASTRRTALSSSSSFHSSVHFRIALRCPTSRIPTPSIRASFQVPAGIRPGSIVETDKLPSGVRNLAMEAVDSYGGRVTIGDVVSKAGLKLNEAERALQALAADTGGFLEVSDEGDVLYTFPKDYRSKLLTKSFKMKVEPFLNKIKTAAAYLVRVSFGTALITSIVLVYTTIIVLASSSSRSEGENGRGRRGRSYDSGVTFLFRPSDLFWYWDMNYYRRRQMRQEGGMNFVESVFSFVFGDGDPNQGLEEERWKLIGQYISSNGGVVAAEELAPYLDVPLIDETQDDESFVLPVLIRFQGYPEVDDQGNILYRFPSLQRTASSLKVGKKEYVGKKWAEWINGVEKYFEEKKWKFSEIGASEKAMVIGLGALNLFGVIVLGSMLKDVSIAPQGLVSFVSQIFPLLQIYAASFFTIPLIRWFLLLRTNQGIEKRNRARKQRAQILDRPDPSLRRKLLNARDMSQQTTISPDRIVYTTEKDFVDQDYEGRDWDERFRELERSD
ncbi:uncharacterized protein At5g03900, chloroplastic-like isoform X1 [Zingiber officinale]|uniref:uncharacterized protein At5g03900, chloroplastic-like isoform X1 n=1 Tax=Zingiber officinale TaxID=94328 RepID=UPI001C4B9F2A|nr:uncharacterized protein At5g03900, chloroplastic-like isoform X1 [Zingiber officinale]